MNANEYILNTYVAADLTVAAGPATEASWVATVGNPLPEECTFRVVSAGLTVWLTTPYISSTGQFLCSRIPMNTNEITPANLYDALGDTPDHLVGLAHERVEIIW